jgi:hypothetical protein
MFWVDSTAVSDVAARKYLVAMGGLWLRATLWLGVVGGSGYLWL